MTRQELKETLSAVKANEFEPPKGVTHMELALEMLKQIGDVDPVLRDELNYEVFCEWLTNGALTHEELRACLDICLDERHLFYGLGENGTDTVFTRSFSALFIASILQVNTDEHFLDSDALLFVTDKLCTWYKNEKDVRGYMQIKGWAHTVAHGADALAELALCEELGREALLRILYALSSRFEQGEYVYIDREPERVCVAVTRALKRDVLSDEDIEAWLDGINEEYTWSGDMQAFYRWVNKQNLLKTLYFALKEAGVKENWSESVAGMVRVE